MEITKKKAAIICYSFSDNFAYMEQKLALAFQKTGLEVLVICTTANRIDPKNVVHTAPGSYVARDGYTVKRLPFIMGGHLPSHKLPIILSGMYEALLKFQPDIIYHMSCSAINLLSVKKYVKSHPDTRLYLDNHATLHNSVNNLFSKVILHQLIYKNILHSMDRYVSEYFYVGQGEKVFIEDFYDIPAAKTGFFPLGDFCLSEKQYEKIRNREREKLKISEDEILVMHSGKFTRQKKTIELMKMMSSLGKEHSRIRFFLIGDVQDAEIQAEFLQLLEENPSRITFLGWRNSQDLSELFCAADIYIQMSPSSSFQTALCRKCIGITTDFNHEYNVYPDNMFYVIRSVDEMKQKIESLSQEGELENTRELHYSRVCENLDYIENVKRHIL